MVRRIFPSRRTCAPLITVVGEKNRLVGADGRAVRPFENPVAPRAQKIAVAVEDDDRMLAPRETVDLIFRIDCDRGDFVKVPIAGQPTPIFHHFVAIVTASYNDTHNNTLLMHLGILEPGTRTYCPGSCSYTCRHASKPPLMLATFLKPFSRRNPVAPRLLLPW